MRRFEAIYFKEKLKIVNPVGYVGIVTLWSKPDWVLKQFLKVGVDLSPKTSPIAVLGTLYGNGFPHLIRNLLYNPQIRLLAFCGRNRSGSLEDLISFFEHGTEKIKGPSPYFLNDQPVAAVRIKGRMRMIDALVQPEDFNPKPEIVLLGELRDQESLDKARTFFSGLVKKDWLLTGKALAPSCAKNISLPQTRVGELPLPCNPRAFVITKKDVVQAWEELVFVLYRFGRTVHLAKGNRKELQNIKVVVEEPSSKPDPKLYQYWFTENQIRQYQKDILSGEEPTDEAYTYGHRIRAYFGGDTLERVAERLLHDREDRKCFIALWDTKRDLEKSSPPCLVSLFLRFCEERLTLTATYRSHNAMDAWIYNLYGLKSILDYVARKANMKPGAITIISHSISIDMDESTMARAELLVEKSRHFAINLDPHGEFSVSIDRRSREIVVQHCLKDGLVLKEYRGNRAERIQHQLYRDMALSDINHAMYLGRQLEKAATALRKGHKFVQD